MKALLSVVILFFCSIFYVNAQVTKGTLLVDGNIGLSYRTIDRGEQALEDLTFQLAPFLAYFISDHLMLGGGINYRLYSFNGRTSSLVRFNPIVRYYINPTSTSLNYFAELQGDFGTSLFDASVGPDNFSFALGANKFLNPNIALEGSLVYLLEDQLSNEYDNVFLLNLGVRAFLSPNDRQNWKQSNSGITKGVMMIGMSEANILLNQTDLLDINLMPNIGYFLTSNIAVGGAVGLGYRKRIDGANFWVGDITIQPFARYYFNPTSRLAWFGEASIGYSLQEFDSFGLLGTTHFFDLGLKGGANLFLTPTLALELTAGWDFSNQDSEFEDTRDLPTDLSSEGEETLNNFGFNIGIQYFWNRGSRSE